MDLTVKPWAQGCHLQRAMGTVEGSWGQGSAPLTLLQFCLIMYTVECQRIL